MSNRVVHLIALSLLAIPLSACPSAPDDPFASFSTAPTSFTTAPTMTANTMDESSDTMEGDGDPMGDGDPGTTGDGDPMGDGDPGTTTSCPPGQFGCPCDNGVCDVGLACVDGECVLDDTTTGDGDPTTTTGGFGPCDPNDPYCLELGCPDTMGQGLVLDIDMDMNPDIGWCQHVCVNDGDCPAQLGTGAVTCEVWNMMGDMACFLNCSVNDPNSCAPGAMCTTDAGPPLCLYDATNF